MKKFASLLLVMLLALGLFAACGDGTKSQGAASSQAKSNTGTESQAPAGELSGKLTFSAWDMTTTDVYDKLKTAFEAKYPGTEIVFIDTPSTEYTDKLSTMLNGGTDFDVFLVKDADTSLSLANKGQLEDLTAEIEARGIQLDGYNGLAKNFNFDGKQYALPFRTDYYVLYYNKDIFDEANIEYPSNDMTWAEFEELAKKLTSGEGANKVYGAHMHTWQALIQNWAIQDGKHTIMGPDYEFMKPYYEMFVRMQDEGIIPDFATLKSANIHYSSAFMSGNAAMLPMGTWFINTMVTSKEAGETDINWGVATIPHPEGLAAGNTVGATTPMSINPASKNKELAWAFLEFCTGPEGAAILAASHLFPGAATPELLEIAAKGEGMPEDLGKALELKGIVLDRPIVEHVNEINLMLEQEHGLIMLGEVTIEEGLATMAERAEEILG